MKPPGHTRTIGNLKDMEYSSWHWKKKKAKETAKKIRDDYNLYARVIEGKNEAGYTVYLVYTKKKKK